ncbi:anti-sigma factor [Crenobacter sp. SG2303]|uniref:Anti-sigma factor n=1 Tax=Crenobacter oryzisoli TaxID=3056844 RepID=A0ABT7XUG7_9NEIS|nr:anti-sigma factor [Crenobacter sp. SG2303]MDN0077446.1 anti-sigma factor [Crenobacter sp. SG2303]
MDCQYVRERLSGHLDRQLAPAEEMAIEQHLSGCPACQAALEQQRLARQLMREQAAQYPMPPGLAAKIRASLPKEPVAAPSAPVWWRRPWLGLSAASLSGALVGAALTLTILPLRPVVNLLPDEVLTAHVRALLPGHLADVASTDQHTVKPWFAGRLDFSPPVYDLASAGFPLVGGRLDYLQHRRVAALVYRYKLHVINVYVWPVDPTAVQRQTRLSRQGYQLVAWNQEGMNFWAVSDLNGTDLGRFVSLLQEKQGGAKEP